MQVGLVARKVSVCLSVGPSNAWIVTKRKKSVQIFIPYQKSFSLVFKKRTIGVGYPFTGNFGSTGLRWSEIADLEPIFARSASAVTPSKKVQ